MNATHRTHLLGRTIPRTRWSLGVSTRASTVDWRLLPGSLGRNPPPRRDGDGGEGAPEPRSDNAQRPAS